MFLIVLLTGFPKLLFPGPMVRHGFFASTLNEVYVCIIKFDYITKSKAEHTKIQLGGCRVFYYYNFRSTLVLSATHRYCRTFPV